MEVNGIIGIVIWEFTGNICSVERPSKENTVKHVDYQRTLFLQSFQMDKNIYYTNLYKYCKRHKQNKTNQ